MTVNTTWVVPTTALGSGGLDVATDDTLPETYFDALASNVNRLGGSDGNTKTGPMGITGVTGAAAASRYAGATASGAPASGDFLVGDYIVDQTGTIWICTGAGSPGTWRQVGNVNVLDRDVTVAEVVSTVAETTVYTFSVPGGTLGTTGRLRLTLLGDILDNAGGPGVVTLRVKYGGTVAWVHNFSPGATNANRRSVWLQVDIAAQNSTSAQVAGGLGVMSGSGGAAAPAADDGGAGVLYTSMNNALAIASASDQTLLVSAQWDTNDAGCSFKAFATIVEKMP